MVTANARTDGYFFEGLKPVGIRCGECKARSGDDLGSLLGIAYRGVNLDTFEIEWWWSPMVEPRSPKSMLAHRPGSIAFQLNAPDSANQPPVVAGCKNGSHDAYRVPRLRLAGIARTQHDRGRENAHVGEDFAVPRATAVQRTTSQGL